MAPVLEEVAEPGKMATWVVVEVVIEEVIDGLLAGLVLDAAWPPSRSNRLAG